MTRRRVPWVALAIAAGTVAAAAGFLHAIGVAANLLVPSLGIVLVVLLYWALMHGMGETERIVWHAKEHGARPMVRQHHETNRLADDVLRAEAGRDMAVVALARRLWTITLHRLVRHHGADPDDPLPTAERVLSAQLYSFFVDVLVDERSLRLRRATLDAYLKEIDAL